MPSIIKSYRIVSTMSLGPDELGPKMARIAYAIDLLQYLSNLPKSEYLNYYYEDLYFEIERILCWMDTDTTLLLNIDFIFGLMYKEKNKMRCLENFEVHQR